jgi:tRNA U38,U39,U40 pseudouridine synthase TruA
MRNIQKNIDYRGRGFLRFADQSSPRMTNEQAVEAVAKAVGKPVSHVVRSAYLGETVHVLQYAEAYEEDMKRKVEKLKSKFNKDE